MPTAIRVSLGNIRVQLTRRNELGITYLFFKKEAYGENSHTLVYSNPLKGNTLHLKLLNLTTAFALALGYMIK